MDIFSAAAEGRINVLDQLLTEGKDVNNTDSYGWTAVHHASSKGQTEVIKYLEAKGADLEASTVYETYGVQRGFTGDEDAGSKPLHLAALYGHTASIKVLVELGAQLESEDKNHKHKPLHKAAYEGHVEAIRYYLIFSHKNHHINQCTYISSYQKVFATFKQIWLAM